MKNYSIEEQDKIGLAIAQMLCLRKDRDNKSRWQTTWGNKTNTGIFNTVCRLGEEINSGEITKTLPV